MAKSIVSFSVSGSERKIHGAPFKKPAANLFNALKIKNKTKGKSEKDSAFRLVFLLIQQAALNPVLLVRDSS